MTTAQSISTKQRDIFPIGWIVGGLSFLVFYLSALLFEPSIAVILSLLCGVLVTGAFHEDGLADVVDGFGGGWKKQDILDIMKDSNIGAFGAIAIVMLFLLKFTALETAISTNKEFQIIILTFISYHSLARLTAVNLIFISSYSRDDATSKVKPIAKTHSNAEVFGAYLFGLIPLGALAWVHWQFLFTVIPLFTLCILSKRYFEKWIQGYTGIASAQLNS